MELSMSSNSIARLETRIDYLETELTYLNDLLIEVGFPQGITTLKETALEVLRDPRPFIHPYVA
jgi:hypothetical protein